MDKYRRVDNKTKREPSSGNENEILITTPGKIWRYIDYSINQLEKGSTEIKLMGMGRAIYKVVTVAELVKRKYPGLHQNTVIDSSAITDIWEPIEEGLDRIETKRDIPLIQISLCKEAIHMNEPGYQPPLTPDTIQETFENNNIGRGMNQGGGFPPNFRGRGRGGFSMRGGGRGGFRGGRGGFRGDRGGGFRGDRGGGFRGDRGGFREIDVLPPHHEAHIPSYQQQQQQQQQETSHIPEHTDPGRGFFRGRGGYRGGFRGGYRGRGPSSFGGGGGGNNYPSNYPGSRGGRGGYRGRGQNTFRKPFESHNDNNNASADEQ